MEEYLSFRKLITPVIIQVVFWILFAVVILGGLVTLTQNFLGGLIIIVLGPIAVRVYAEILIVLFQINDALQEMRESSRRASAAPATTPPATM